MSIGFALLFTPLFTVSLSSVRPELYSHGSAVLGSLQQVAGAAGVALFVALMSAQSGEADGGGRGTARGARRRHSRGLPVRRRHRAARRRSAHSSCASPTPRRCPARTEPRPRQPSRSVRVPDPPGSATISSVTRWRRDGRGEQRMQPADRLHALDAVRAYALLLGVVLHSAAAFLEGFPIPMWLDKPSSRRGRHLLHHSHVPDVGVLLDRGFLRARARRTARRARRSSRTAPSASRCRCFCSAPSS